jgi:ketosteroid isomerase-like protein
MSADDLVALTRRYLDAIERHDGSALAFYAPDVVQVELPNRFLPAGATRDLAAIREAGERGRQVLTAERYDVRSALASDDRVALEVLWTGTLAVPVGTIPAGCEMRAHFAMFVTFRDGKIVEQRNYDCFEAF